MTVKSVLVYPDSNLRVKANPVEDVQTEEIINLCNDLKDTMAAYAAEGVAATQIGVHKQVIVVKVNDQPLIIMNPVVLGSSDTIQSNEGCLSFPGVHENVERARSLTISGLNEDGIKAVWCFDDKDAVAVQHEMDHLNGILFIDRVSQLKKRFMLKKLDKMKKKFGIR